MIDYIDFVEFDKYLGLGVPTSEGGNLPPLSAFPSYPGFPEYDPYYLTPQLYNQYTKVFDFKYNAKETVNETGYFAQAPSTIEFNLNSDSFLRDNILDPAQDRTEKYSRYVVRVIEDNVCIFEGLIILDQTEYDHEKELIKIVAMDFLVLVSDIKDEIINTEDQKMGFFMDDVIRNNEDCLRFILSRSATKYFPYSYNTLETWGKELDVTTFLSGNYTFTPEETGCGITAIQANTYVYYEFSGNFVNRDNRWAIWEFTSFEDMEGTLVLYRWAYNNSIKKYEIRARFYTVNTINDTYTYIDKIMIPLTAHWFVNSLSALGVKDAIEATYRSQKYTVCANSEKPSAVVGTMRVRTTWNNEQYFTFKTPNYNMGFYITIGVPLPPPSIPGIDEWQAVSVPSGYSTNAFCIDLTEVISLFYSAYITSEYSPTEDSDEYGTYRNFIIRAKVTGYALGFSNTDISSYNFTNSGGSDRSVGDYKTIYANLNDTKNKLNIIRYDTKYYIYNTVVWYTEPSIFGYRQDNFYDYKQIFKPTFNYTPIDTAYLNGFKYYENSIRIKREVLTGFTIDYFPISTGTVNVVASNIGDTRYFTVARVFKPTGASYVVFDLRHFAHEYAGSASGYSGAITNKWFTWRFRIVLLVSGANKISSPIIEADVLIDPDQGINGYTTNPLYTEKYVDRYGEVDILPLSGSYTEPGTDQLYHQDTSTNPGNKDFIRESYNIYYKDFNIRMYFRGLVYAESTGWLSNNEISIGTLMQGILMLNNTSIRADKNLVYFEGRGNADAENIIPIDELDIVELKSLRITEESPTVDYLSNVETFDETRLKDVVDNYYSDIFKQIKLKTTFELSEIFNTYNVDINNTISLFDRQYKVVRIKKQQDKIYEIEAWNVPYVEYGIKKEGISTVSIYGIRKEGDTEIYNYGLKGV